MPTLNRSYGSTVQNGKANGQDDGQGARSSQDKPGLEPRNQSLGAVWKRKMMFMMEIDMKTEFGHDLEFWKIMFLFKIAMLENHVPIPGAGSRHRRAAGWW